MNTTLIFPWNSIWGVVVTIGTPNKRIGINIIEYIVKEVKSNLDCAEKTLVFQWSRAKTWLPCRSDFISPYYKTDLYNSLRMWFTHVLLSMVLFQENRLTWKDILFVIIAFQISNSLLQKHIHKDTKWNHEYKTIYHIFTFLLAHLI